MGAILVSEIFERTGRILNDEGSTRWTSSELLDWYNEGLLDMVTRVPSVLPSIDTFACVAGTLQSIPSERIAIIDIGQNIGSVEKPRNGAVPRYMAKEVMDSLIPDWQHASTSIMVQIVIGSKQIPSKFWVYPPQPALNQGRLTITFSKRPTLVTATTGAIEIDDQYAPVVIEYLLYRALLKDAENANMAPLASQHLQNYLGMLGVGQQQEK